jgi:hypothetical protein
MIVEFKYVSLFAFFLSISIKHERTKMFMQICWLIVECVDAMCLMK